jgi:hypothetical protein
MVQMPSPLTSSLASYLVREEVKPLVNRVPGNIHQGFDTQCKAERAYVIAYTLGAVHVLPLQGDVGQRALSLALPVPYTIMNAFASSSDTFLGAEWHIVFKGLRPGVYPAW